MIKANFHTHTSLCDGHNTLEEMILSAIDKKFDVLGFSEHSMYPFAGTWHLPVGSHAAYVQEVKNLSQKYADKIKIYAGFEADYFPGLTYPDMNFYKVLNPDYLIGSVHFVAAKNGHFSADTSADRIKQGVDYLYGGNYKKAVCDYFYAEKQMLKYGNFDVIGHPDVIRKRNGELKMFSENESWYKKEIKSLAKEISKAGVICEINSGAIGRKIMDDFYPSFQFLEYLKDYNVPVMISSDSHSIDTLDVAFDRAREQVKKLGYKELVYPIIGAVKLD